MPAPAVAATPTGAVHQAAPAASAAAHATPGTSSAPVKAITGVTGVFGTVGGVVGVGVVGVEACAGTGVLVVSVGHVVAADGPQLGPLQVAVLVIVPLVWVASAVTEKVRAYETPAATPAGMSR